LATNWPATSRLAIPSWTTFRVTELPQRPNVTLAHHARKGGKDDNRPSILAPDFMRWLEQESGSYLWVNLTDVRMGLQRVEVREDELTVITGGLGVHQPDAVRTLDRKVATQKANT